MGGQQVHTDRVWGYFKWRRLDFIRFDQDGCLSRSATISMVADRSQV